MSRSSVYSIGRGRRICPSRRRFALHWCVLLQIALLARLSRVLQSFYHARIAVQVRARDKVDRNALLSDLVQFVRMYPPLKCPDPGHYGIDIAYDNIKSEYQRLQTSAGYSAVAVHTILASKAWSDVQTCTTCMRLVEAHFQLVKAAYTAKHGWIEA